MTTAEKIELTLIPIVGICLWLIASFLPDRMSIGSLLIDTSALLLLQGFFRDLWLLSQQKKTSPDLQRKMQCMCAESTFGMTGILFGIILLGVGIDLAVPMPQWGWSVLVMIVMTIGFLIKDYVIEWNPFRIYKDLDHINIIFTWKK
jgi:hypothetical protein